MQIKTVKYNVKALAFLKVLWNSPEADILEALVTLIYEFEKESYSIDAPAPI